MYEGKKDNTFSDFFLFSISTRRHKIFINYFYHQASEEFGFLNVLRI